MPKYKITSPDGRIIELEGDRPPSLDTIKKVFASIPPEPEIKDQVTFDSHQVPPIYANAQAEQEPKLMGNIRDYSVEAFTVLSIVILLSYLYLYPIVKKKAISGWRRLFLVMVVIPGTVFAIYGSGEPALFLAMAYCFVFGVVWTIQGFRKK